MREVLEQGRSSILLVPEIGLTPAVAADLHQVFGDEVAILHSGAVRCGAGGAVASHKARRGAGGGGHPLGSVRAGQRSGAALLSMRNRIRLTSRKKRRATTPAMSRSCGQKWRGRCGAGLGHAVARVLLQREEKQVCPGGAARPGGAAPAAGGRDRRHAAGVSGNGAGAGDLAQAGGGDSRAAGKKRAGHGAAQPARIFPGGVVPRLRQDVAMQELRRVDDAPQA